MTVLSTGPIASVGKTIADKTEVLATAATGWNKVRLIGIMVTAKGVATFRVFSGAVEHIPEVDLAAKGQYFLNVDGIGWFDTADDTPLKMAVTGSVSVTCRYQSIT